MAISVVALPGDGIGQEVLAAGIEVLKESSRRHGLNIELEEYKVGGQAIDAFGIPLPDEVVAACRRSGIVLLGAVGDPRFDGNPRHLRPERALLGLRKELNLFANLRPIKTFPSLLSASTLKPEVVRDVDMLIVRELTGGIYFGTPRGLETRSGRRVGFNSEIYFDQEIERIAKVGFEAARLRRKSLTSVDKSNVLESSQLWRTVVDEVSEEYEDVRLNHILVDNCAMQLIVRPRDFDVLLTNNMFGDILSDEAAMLTGSIGMLPSASLGEDETGRRMGMYEPVHGSAPDIAGQGTANPLAAIGSVAMMFRYSLDREDIAVEIEKAVNSVLEKGFRTPDLSRYAAESSQVLGTRGMLDQVLGSL